jgi:hypothetical protein
LVRVAGDRLSLTTYQDGAVYQNNVAYQRVRSDSGRPKFVRSSIQSNIYGTPPDRFIETVEVDPEVLQGRPGKIKYTTYAGRNWSNGKSWVMGVKGTASLFPENFSGK